MPGAGALKLPLQQALDPIVSGINGHNNGPVTDPLAQSLELVQEFTRAVGHFVGPRDWRVQYNYEAQDGDAVSIVEGEMLRMIEDTGDGWAKVEKADGSKGFVPLSYIIQEAQLSM